MYVTSPRSIGALPLIVGGAAVAGSGVYAAGQTTWGQAFLQWFGLIRETGPPPVRLPAPAAPVTQEEMTRGGAWTPEEMYLRTAELGREYMRGRTETLAVSPMPQREGEGGTRRLTLYLTLAIGAAAVLALVAGRRGR